MLDDLKAIEKVIVAVRQHVLKGEKRQALAAIDLLSDRVAVVRDAVEATEIKDRVENFR